MARLRSVILSATLLLGVAPARAATVAIVRPQGTAPGSNETLSRLHGELLSVGLEVEIVENPASRQLGASDGRAWLAEIAAEHGVDAVIDIVGDAAPVAVDIYVIDTASRTLDVARVTPEPGTDNASGRLAIRAIEVLRSRFLEIDLSSRKRRGEPVVPPPPTAGPPDAVLQPASHPQRVGIEAGAAVLTSLDGVGPAFLPLLRLDWAAFPWLVVQAALAGLGSRPTVATMVGNARVAQQYALLGGCLRGHGDRWLQPFLALSAGALRTSVEGRAASPRQGHAVDQWSFLLDGGLGVGLRLRGRYHLALAAHVQLAAPYVAIHFADAVVATSGGPNLLLTLTVGAWL